MGEPDQSGGSYHHSLDSANQAMFNEKGEPNPKYWAFYLMSTYFRDTYIFANSSDWERFSVHVCRRNNGDNNIIVTYKGEYDPQSGDFIEGQSSKIAQIEINGLSEREKEGLKIKKVVRYGKDDPYVVEIENLISSVEGIFTYEFEPLSIYVFVISTTGEVSNPDTYFHVNPKRIDFGPYETKMPLRITNVRAGKTDWSIELDSSWLTINGPSCGSAKVTDTTYISVNRSNLFPGLYETKMVVKTTEGNIEIPVTMEVIPGEAGGEKRICDFETGSLIHVWHDMEPYSIGCRDGHGTPEDRSSPLFTNFSLMKKKNHYMVGDHHLRLSLTDHKVIQKIVDFVCLLELMDTLKQLLNGELMIVSSLTSRA